MSKKTFLGVMVIALVVAVTAGGLYASNMGFKLNYALAQSGGGSNSGQTTLGLPDNRQSGLTDAITLMNDIGFNSVQNVQRFLKSSDTFQAYTGRKLTQGNWPLVSGEGVIVKMQTTVNYIVVGSDNPTLSYNLDQQGGGSNSGQSFFAYNYHQTAADAISLMNDIGFNSVQNVQRFLKSSDTFQAYTGRKLTQGNFPLVPGEAYVIKMQTTVNYTPSHY